MVTVIDFVKRTNSEGKEFNALLLQGEVEMIKSQKTGKFYATAKTCSITSTFDDTICQSLIGKELPGNIEKVKCEPYEYQIPNTKEAVTLNFIYQFNPVQQTMEQEVFEGKADERKTVNA